MNKINNRKVFSFWRIQIATLLQAATIITVSQLAMLTENSVKKKHKCYLCFFCGSKNLMVQKIKKAKLAEIVANMCWIE